MLRRQLQVRLWKPNIRNYALGPSSASVGPPLLAKIREDLKAAMRAKEKIQLDVLRGLISDTTNAAKASTPIISDNHMIQIIRKRVKSCESAAREAEDANRNDLRDRELQQIAILEAYIQDSNIMSEEDVKEIIQETISKIRTEGKKADKGNVMKALVGPTAPLEGHPVDKKRVAEMVVGML